MPIGETDLLAIRNTKAPVHSARHAPWSGGRLGHPASAKRSGREDGALRVMRPARPRIHRLSVAFIRRTSRQRHILPRTSARVNKLAVEQTLPCLEVESPPLALRVRAVRAATVRPLAPLNPEPAQILEHCRHEFGAATLRIQVFVAKNQLSMISLRTLRGNRKRARMA